jgi:hypothetical protein
VWGVFGYSRAVRSFRGEVCYDHPPENFPPLELVAAAKVRSVGFGGVIGARTASTAGQPPPGPPTAQQIWGIHQAGVP